MAKPLVVFLPVYIGSLKYYEKLIPTLSKTHDVSFLIVRENDERRRQMIDYLDGKRYRYSVIDQPKVSGGVPVMSAVLKKREHARLARAKLLELRPSVIVSMKSTSAFESIFKEANYLKIRTVVLQVALVAPKGHYGPSETDVTGTEALYLKFVSAVNFLATLATKGGTYAGTSSQPQQVGVIDERARDVYVERFGFKPSHIEVVGNADFSIMHDLVKKISDSSYGAIIKKKYGIDDGKKVILIISSWAGNYIHAKIKHTEEENREQINYYGKLIGRVRREFSPEEAHVLFKLHPSEANIYREYESQGVIILGDSALPEELVAICDLYIADPATSANYMVIATDKPAIFVNTTQFHSLNTSAKFFGITTVAETIEDFSKLLRSLKNQAMPASYRKHSDPESIERIVKFIAG